ncbi:MAG: type I-C CRISPR-associated endonuclease Cas1c [Coriobacteriia bacterium]|nr:type I-C CRISPR-associated endonuclease Cas1c [Coriobacteriia bacterium]
MRRLLNTLYVNRPDCYLALEGETVVVQADNSVLIRVPFINLEGIVVFGYRGVSPALMGACAERGVGLTFLAGSGRFLARVVGEPRGNVVLRKQQYRISDDEHKSCEYAKSFVFGKIYNSKWVLQRVCRDHPLRVNVEEIKAASRRIDSGIADLFGCENLGVLRGVEGNAAAVYFQQFGQLILRNEEFFQFKSRQKRPAVDPVNALLSFAYAMLGRDCQVALEGAGLDSYVGFLHRDRPGRHSLALDLMEELRSPVADRFVLSLINRAEMTSADFDRAEGGAVRLTENGRKRFLNSWQNRKHEAIVHPYLREKLEWGLVPHVQALLLARTIRGDLDKYPPFLWK